MRESRTRTRRCSSKDCGLEKWRFTGVSAAVHREFSLSTLPKTSEFFRLDDCDAAFEVIVQISRTKTHGLQQYGQSRNGYKFDPKKEATECGGTAAGIIIQLVLRGAIAPEDVIDSDKDFLRRHSGAKRVQLHGGVSIKLEMEKGSEPLFLAVSNTGCFVRQRLSPARMLSVVEQYAKLFDVPSPCVSPRSLR